MEVGTPKRSKPNFSGITPEAGDGYKAKYGELIQNLKDSLRLCALKKLKAVSPKQLTNNSLQSEHAIPRRITEDVRLAIHNKEVATAVDGRKRKLKRRRA